MSHLPLPITLGLCVRCGIRIPSARNRCPAFDKDKYLELMLGDVASPNQSSDMQKCGLLQPQATLAQNPLLAAVLVSFRHSTLLINSSILVN